MNRFTIIALILLFFKNNSFANQNSDTISSFDWNKDGILDEFIFTPLYNKSSPADFLYFKVKISGKGVYEFASIDSYWVMHTRDECFAPKKYIDRHNLILSNYAVLLDVKIKGKSNPLLFLFGFAPANEPGWLDVYGLNTQCEPYNIKSEQTDLCEILDMDRDGFSEIVFLPAHEYDMNDYKQYHYNSYAPFYVYTITDSMHFKFNIKLTGLYNRKHYIGWAGLDSARQYIIWENPKTKKRIFTTLEKAKRVYFK